MKKALDNVIVRLSIHYGVLLAIITRSFNVSMGLRGRRAERARIMGAFLEHWAEREPSPSGRASTDVEVLGGVSCWLVLGITGYYQ
jgi:hypothetical protein